MIRSYTALSAIQPVMYPFTVLVSTENPALQRAMCIQLTGLNTFGNVSTDT